MRWVIAALVTLAVSTVHASQPPAEAAPVAALDEPTLIIDVRTAEEAYNVSKHQTVLLYCRSGNRSGHAEVRLQSAGFSGAKNVGGLNALLAATGRTAALPNH